MPDYPFPQEAYNAAGKPFWECNFLWIKTSTGNTFGFSDRRRSEIVIVEDIRDGSDLERTYDGGGHIIELPEITRPEGLVSQQHQLVLSGASETVRNMAFGGGMARAVIEWHKGQIHDDTGLLVARPVCELYGLIDEVADNITELGPERSAEWTVTLTVITHHAELEYSNPAMRSYEAGLERDGDEIFLYVDSVPDWNIMWGKKSHKHRSGRPDGKPDGKPGDRPLGTPDVGSDPWGHTR